MLKSYFKKIALAALATIGMQNALQAQGPKVQYVGGSANERFYYPLVLSDSTILIPGRADNMNWLPSYVTVQNLSLGTLNTADAENRGFIIRVNKRMDSILAAVVLPPNTVTDITRVKTNSLPGQPTGDIFISGRRGGVPSGQRGWYFGKLNNNFLSGTPTEVSWVTEVRGKPRATNQFSGPWPNNGQDPDHTIWQPWDVDAQGRVYYVTGTEFEADWAALYRRKADGTADDTVNHWPVHNADWQGQGQYSGVTGGVEIRGTTLAGALSRKVWVRVNPGAPSEVPPIFDSAVVTNVRYSGIILKVNRNGSNLRSHNLEDFAYISNDENGNPDRRHKYPGDYFYANPCITGNCDNSGPGYTGYSHFNPNNNTATERCVALNIDKRNGNLYFGMSTYSQSRFPRPYDFEPAVVAMDPIGNIRWWARCMPEDTALSPAAQAIDGMALDYTNNEVVVVGRTIGNSPINFWKGNSIRASLGNAFQNEYTGDSDEKAISWLGRYKMDSLQIVASTYVGELDANQALGTPMANPLYDGWSSLNDGAPNLAETRVWDVQVMAGGEVAILGTSTGRTFTTANAWFKMPKPDRDAVRDSLPAGNTFIRVYSRDLQNVVYSTLVEGLWDSRNGNQGNHVSGTGIAVYGNGIVFSGFSQLIPNTTQQQGGLLPTVFEANSSIGRAAPELNDGILAYLPVIGAPLNTVAAPEGINGPVAQCQNSQNVYRIINPVSGAKYHWTLPNYGNYRGFSDRDTLEMLALFGPGGTLRAARVENGYVSGMVSLALQEPGATQRPSAISGPTAANPHCRGTERTYQAIGSQDATSYRWFLPNSGWQIPGVGVVDSIETVSDTIRVLVMDTTTRGGSIRVKALGVCGASTIFSRNLTNPVAAPVNPTINVNGQVLSLAGPTTGLRFQWLRNGQPITGATSATFNTQGRSDCYAVVVSNACGADTSVGCITSLAKNFSGASTTKVYPNPVSDQLTIQLPQGVSSTTYQITDMAGKVVVRKQVNVMESEVQLSVAGLERGIYLLQVNNAAEQATFRIVKE